MDLSFKKMPIEFLKYYSLSEPYISSYHKIGKIDKAQNLYKKIERKISWSNKILFYLNERIQRDIWYWWICRKYYYIYWKVLEFDWRSNKFR